MQLQFLRKKRRENGTQHVLCYVYSISCRVILNSMWSQTLVGRAVMLRCVLMLQQPSRMQLLYRVDTKFAFNGQSRECHAVEVRAGLESNWSACSLDTAAAPSWSSYLDPGHSCRAPLQQTLSIYCCFYKTRFALSLLELSWSILYPYACFYNPWQTLS